MRKKKEKGEVRLTMTIAASMNAKSDSDCSDNGIIKLFILLDSKWLVEEREEESSNSSTVTTHPVPALIEPRDAANTSTDSSQVSTAFLISSITIITSLNSTSTRLRPSIKTIRPTTTFNTPTLTQSG